MKSSVIAAMVVVGLSLSGPAAFADAEPTTEPTPTPVVVEASPVPTETTVSPTVEPDSAPTSPTEATPTPSADPPVAARPPRTLPPVTVVVGDSSLDTSFDSAVFDGTNLTLSLDLSVVIDDVSRALGSTEGLTLSRVDGPTPSIDYAREIGLSDAEVEAGGFGLNHVDRRWMLSVGTYAFDDLRDSGWNETLIDLQFITERGDQFTVRLANLDSSELNDTTGPEDLLSDDLLTVDRGEVVEPSDVLANDDERLLEIYEERGWLVNGSPVKVQPVSYPYVIGRSSIARRAVASEFSLPPVFRWVTQPDAEKDGKAVYEVCSQNLVLDDFGERFCDRATVTIKVRSEVAASTTPEVSTTTPSSRPVTKPTIEATPTPAVSPEPAVEVTNASTSNPTADVAMTLGIDLIALLLGVGVGASITTVGGLIKRRPSKEQEG